MDWDENNIACGVCHVTITGEIWQCNNGHIVCTECKYVLLGHGNTCPTCKCKTTFEARNRQLETLHNPMKMACPFECKTTEPMLREAMGTHVALRCPKRILHCPFREGADIPLCPSFGGGTADEWMKHIVTEHAGVDRMDVLVNAAATPVDGKQEKKKEAVLFDTTIELKNVSDIVQGVYVDCPVCILLTRCRPKWQAVFCLLATSDWTSLHVVSSHERQGVLRNHGWTDWRLAASCHVHLGPRGVGDTIPGRRGLCTSAPNVDG